MSTLNHRPSMLSFEFNLAPHLEPVARACVAEVARLRFSEANFTTTADTRLILERWVTCDRVLEEIERVAAGRPLWGDIFVR